MGSGFIGGGSQPAAPEVCPACGNVYMEASKFCRKCGMKRPEGVPPSMVITPAAQAPPRPSWKNASLGPPIISAPRPSPAIQAPSPAAVPEVPMWREQVEQRKHIIEFDLEEVRLHREFPDLVPGWHQSTTYKVLLLPF